MSFRVDRRGAASAECDSLAMTLAHGSGLIALAAAVVVVLLVTKRLVARRSGLGRDQIFITSKLSNDAHLPDDARRTFDETLARLGVEYVDLFLIHWPLPTRYNGDFVSTWKVLEEFKRDGRAHSIGVSNFQTYHLERLFAETETVPAVNQIEAHPFFTNDDVREFGKRHGIVTEAYSPIATGKVLNEPTVVALADKLGRTPAQLVLRWHIQLGNVVFPKSSKPHRMRENIALFDFELNSAEMAQISALNRGESGRLGAHPDTLAS